MSNVEKGASIVFGPKFWCKQELVEHHWVTGASLSYRVSQSTEVQTIVYDLRFLVVNKRRSREILVPVSVHPPYPGRAFSMEGGREGGSEGGSEGGREEERGTVLLPCPSQGLWPSCITFIYLHAIKWLVSISKLLACLLSDSWLQRMITAVGAYWVPHSHAHCMLRYCPGYPPPQQSLPRGYSAHMMEHQHKLLHALPVMSKCWVWCISSFRAQILVQAGVSGAWLSYWSFTFIHAVKFADN